MRIHATAANRQAPYYHPWMNHLRAALYAFPAGLALVNVALSWPVKRVDPAWSNMLTTAALAAAGGAVAAVGAVSWVRWKWGPERAVKAFRCEADTCFASVFQCVLKRVRVSSRYIKAVHSMTSQATHASMLFTATDFTGGPTPRNWRGRPPRACGGSEMSTRRRWRRGCAGD
jgi:hypothetical protein